MSDANVSLQSLAEKVEDLQQRVTSQNELIARQQVALTKQQAVIEQQQVALTKQQAALAALLAGEPREHHGSADEVQMHPAKQHGRREPRLRAPSLEGNAPRTTSSRRSLLKLGGVAAVAATGVALVAGEPTAQASPLSDGGNLVIGALNTAELSTVLSFDGTGQLSAAFLEVDDTIVEGTGAGAVIAGLVGPNPASLNNAGVRGHSDVSNSTLGMSTTGIGVLGTSNNGVGVWAHSDDSINGSPALLAEHVGSYDGAHISGANNQTGVLASVGGTVGNGIVGKATGTGAFGVWGQSDSGYGIVGSTSTGIDLYAASTGRILQALQTTPGAPTTGTHLVGEQVRDSNGELWLCTFNGTPGTWVKAAHALAGLTGGAITYLAKPVRLLDTRPGETDAVTNGGGPYTASGSPYTIQVAGVSFNSVTIPSTAAGIFGNIQALATSAAGSGHLSLVPHGAGNELGILSYSANQVVGNCFNVALSSGEVDLYVVGNSTNVILDVWSVVA